MSALTAPRLAPLSGTARQLVVLVHGYGADGNDLLELGRVWQTRFPDTAFVAPNAPDPAPAGTGFQWFPISRLDPDETEKGTAVAGPVLDAFLDAELKALNLRPENLVILGFSQGAMLALHVGLRRKVAPRAILAFSGLLAGQVPTPAPGGAWPPIFISHGDSDQVVPPQMMFIALGVLQQIGAKADWHLARNTGHGIDPESLELAAKFLETPPA